MTYTASAEICAVLLLSWRQALTEAFFSPQLSLDRAVLREGHPLAARSVQHTRVLVKQCNCEWREGEEREELRRKAGQGARSGGHRELCICKQDAVKISAEKGRTPVQCNVLLLHPAPRRCQAAGPDPQLYRHLWSPKKCSKGQWSTGFSVHL